LAVKPQSLVPNRLAVLAERMLAAASTLVAHASAALDYSLARLEI
jgi:hypothetical protein